MLSETVLPRRFLDSVCTCEIKPIQFVSNLLSLLILPAFSNNTSPEQGLAIVPARASCNGALFLHVHVTHREDSSILKFLSGVLGKTLVKETL